MIVGKTDQINTREVVEINCWVGLSGAGDLMFPEYLEVLWLR